MNAVDTNVFVYSADADAPVKRPKARALIEKLRLNPSASVLPWQVAAEFLACLRRWESGGRISSADVEANIRDLLAGFLLVSPTANVVSLSLSLSSRFSLSHWDSMLLAACIEAGVDTLYSEDLGAGMTYDSVTVINPFG